MSPDINVLLAASRSDRSHQVALTWLEDAPENSERGGSIEILLVVVAGFLRLSTNPRMFIQSTSSNAAVAFLDSLLASPGVTVPEIGREWPLFKLLCARDQLLANAILGAWVAVAIKNLGSHLVTFDRGFKRILERTQLTVPSP